MNNLGERLKEVRLKAGLTLRELARQASVSPSFVSQIENGRSQPSVATLYTFSKLLNVSVDELFEQLDAEVPEQAELVLADGPADPFHDFGPVNPSNAWQPSEYSNRVSVVHPSHRPHLTMAEGVVWERLAATPEHAVNFMKVTYAPGATGTSDGRQATHDGYEYGYVLVGTVQVTIGDEVFLLHAGESLGFDSAIPHVLHNPGPDVFEGLWFVHGRTH